MDKSSATSQQVADFFIEKGLLEDNAVSPMKLQKLMYYAYGWHLAYFDTKLFNSGIQAWKYGPVIREIYHKYKRYGNDPIFESYYENILKGKEDSYSPELVSFLSGIWEIYSPFSALQLSQKTHIQGTPWYQVAEKYNFIPPPETVIPDGIIKEYFLFRKSQAGIA